MAIATKRAHNTSTIPRRMATGSSSISDNIGAPLHDDRAALQGVTPLHMAARHGQAEAVMALVEADRPGVVDAVCGLCAAVCCRSKSALVSMRDKVDALRPPAPQPFLPSAS